MSQAVFVDTSAWYALADAGDTYHAPAARLMRRLLDTPRTLVVSNHVVGETYTLLRVRLGPTVATEFLQRLRGSARTRRVFVPEPWELEAEDLLAKYADQDLSYVDATTFVVMHHLAIKEALAFDHHFVVLGFVLIADFS
ncbi:MAG: PIN domain-containing protein [Chloroflexi bacterium]|nr:PIN domain-containing protein [Chloroflexota bacterium]